jgi:hypothetical protein
MVAGHGHRRVPRCGTRKRHGRTAHPGSGAAGGAADDARLLEGAIHKHFVRKIALATRELRVLLRRGWISLLIGLAFLIALLTLSEVVTARLTAGALADVLHESLVIGGWVAMWRPLEISLYDWWPFVGKRRTYEVLARIPIRILR